MNRAILLECWPWFIALVVSFAVLLLLAASAGARLRWARMRELHRCQQGSAQSLSFVLTLPIFIMVVMFIVQVSQLMIGITIVHYSAFAAARAAMVWFPAMMTLPGEVLPPNQVLMVPPDDPTYAPQYSGNRWVIPPINYATPQQLWKYRKVWGAAVTACMPIAPSGMLYQPSSSTVQAQTTAQIYQALTPNAPPNPRIPIRLQNKLSYSIRNTSVQISGIDKDSEAGPASYNPRNHPDPDVVWNPYEIGWEDPITVTVQHNFALLPGPGRWLIRQLTSPNGQPDQVSSTIQVLAGDTGEPFYATTLTASATLSNEGLKSMMPGLLSND